MSSFEEKINTALRENSRNSFSDNFDFYRYKKPNFVSKLKSYIGRLIHSNTIFSIILSNSFLKDIFLVRRNKEVYAYLDKLASMYEKLEDDASKKLLITLICYRILGHYKVKMPFNDEHYWTQIKKLEATADNTKNKQLNAPPGELKFFDLKEFGHDFCMLFTAEACNRSILKNHYQYQSENDELIKANQGDVVLDLGGCFGDTALYFAEKVGVAGRVFVFEFIPENIAVLKENLALNPHLSTHIELVEHPIWNSSDQTIYYFDNGPGSKVSFEDFEESEGTCTTISIDDFVERKGLKTVDFIKTDIEGAEPFAIEGAVKTLRKFKPTLAISIYHGMDDFTGLIQQINNLNLGYTFYLRHASIHNEETVLFCKP